MQEWDEDEYEFYDETSKAAHPSGGVPSSTGPSPVPDNLDFGMIPDHEDPEEQVFVGFYTTRKRAERVEFAMWKFSVFKAVVQATANTFKAQWRTLLGSGHSQTELVESSKRALGRLTLASGAKTIEDRTAAYGMIRQDEHDYLLAAASSLQAGVGILSMVREEWGDEAVDSILTRCGIALMELQNEAEPES